MDRFTNSYENEYAWCQGGCDRKFHYTELTAKGYCQDCEAERLERELEKQKEQEDARTN